MGINYKNDQLGGILNYQALLIAGDLPLENGRVLYYTIVWIKDGILNLEVDFTTVEAAKNTILFLTPNQFIRLINDEQVFGYVVSFNREFYCIETHEEEVSCNGLLFKGILDLPVIKLENGNEERIESIFTNLEEESNVQDRVQEDMLKVLLKQLIIFCTRMAKDQLSITYHLEEDETDTIRHFSILVEKHFRQKHKVTDYATMLNKSPKTLANLFKKYNSEAPSEMIKERIILEAKRALIYTNLSNKEIAYDLGFEDPAHFSRYFSNATSHSPTRFKKLYFKRG